MLLNSFKNKSFREKKSNSKNKKANYKTKSGIFASLFILLCLTITNFNLFAQTRPILHQPRMSTPQFNAIKVLFTPSNGTTLTQKDVENTIASLPPKQKIYAIFHNSITTIGANAFEGLNNLVGVALNNNVSGTGNITTIQQFAFRNCRNLTEVLFGGQCVNGSSIPPINHVSSGVTFIGDGAFSGCSSLAVVLLAGQSFRGAGILHPIKDNMPYNLTLGRDVFRGVAQHCFFLLENKSYLRAIENVPSIVVLNDLETITHPQLSPIPDCIPIIFNLAQNAELDRMMVKTAFYNLQLVNYVTNITASFISGDIQLSVKVNPLGSSYSIGEGAFGGLSGGSF